LKLDDALPLMSEEAVAKYTAHPEKWNNSSFDRETVLAQMREYMEFAWGKVDDHRGLSAGRSVEKFEAWVWLLADQETLDKMNAADYPQYGAPKLAVVCEAYGFPIPDDEGIRSMIQGLACHADCENGCGS